MDSSNDCFTCGQKPNKFFPIANRNDESKPNICLVMCQHFWFKEDDLRSGIICELCWEKVDQFHRFYQEVKELKEDQLDSKPLSSFVNVVKEEELCIPFSPMVPEQAETPNLDAVECKLETDDESVGMPDNDSSSSFSEPQKPAKRVRTRRNTSKVPKPTRVIRRRKKVPPEQQKAEDEFIRQHRPYSCEYCFDEFEEYNLIRRHSLKAHGKPYIVCCDNQYRNRAMLYEHVQNVLNPVEIKCEICERTFKFKSGYQRHKEEVHPEEHQLIYKCSRCPKSFSKQKLLTMHEREHETLENEKAKCETCGKCFKTKLRLKRHVIQVHDKTFSFICEVCSKGFMKRCELTAHKAYHHEHTADQLKKQCPICNKWLKNLRYWRKHVDRHQKAGEHKCDQCNHVSINLMSLKLHIERKHGPNIKKYVCDMCGKEYSRPVTLKEHIANAHTGEPLYDCPFCEKKFFSNATMYSHKKKAHPQLWLADHNAKYASVEQA